MLEQLLNEDADPIEIIGMLKSVASFDTAYKTKVRHYTLQEHTLLVLSEFDKYFSQIDTFLPKNLFRFILSVHDIGKPKAYLSGNINNQYAETVSMIEKIRPFLPFSQAEINFGLSVINGDPIGHFFQDKIASISAAEKIKSMNISTQFPVKDFFRMLTIYYQCDAGSYTKDAGGLPFLERLFLYTNGSKTMDSEKGVLRFSPIFETKYRTLETAIK